MRRILALCIVAAMASTSFAYVPLSNSQTNLGSYQNAATQGMFYNELDVISSYPVELLDFEGNNLYTTWSNARNFAASNNTRPTPLSWGNNANVANLSVLQLGVSGNPLAELFGIEDSRSAIVYQNYGGKAATIDLDADATTGDGGGFDSTYHREDILLTKDATVGSLLKLDTQNTEFRDVEFWTNTTNTQWNAGIAKKELIIDGLSVGLGLAHRSNVTVLNAGGTKANNTVYLNDDAAIVPGARQGNYYSATYTDDQTHQNSTYTTDVLAQSRYGLMDNLTLTGGIGIRYAVTLNPGGLIGPAGAIQAASLEKDAVMFTASDDQAAAGIQYFNTATAIKNRTQLNYAVAPTVAAMTAAGIWDGNAANAGTTDFSDKRTGYGPMLTLQGDYAMDKIDLTGVLNYSNVKQTIDATQTLQDRVISHTQNAAALHELATYTETDMTATVRSEGENTTTNIDVGGKIDFKMLDSIKLAIGGFIQTNTVKNNFSKVTANLVDRVSYDDGNSGSAPGTVSTTVKPGPAGGDGFGATVGGGEGTWVETIDREFTGGQEVKTVTYSIPIGMEMPIYKDKWIFRAGTSYVMEKKKTTNTSTRLFSQNTKVVTPAGKATETLAAIDAQPFTDENAYNEENHTTFYTYGVQWNVNKSLTLAANAVLNQSANVGGGTNATIFDLDNYRNVSLQAVFHF